MGVRNCGELGIELQKIVKQLFANQKLCKLLYYRGLDPLNEPDIEDTSVLLNENIFIVPKYNPIETDKSTVVISVKGGYRDSKNSEYRNIVIRCFVYVPTSSWIIKNDNLRPFLILGELENSLSGKNVNGLGVINAGSFEAEMITEQMTCYSIDFEITNFR